MKNILTLFLVLTLISCNTKEKSPKTIPLIAEIKDIHPELYGSWVGTFIAGDSDDEMEEDFSARKINLTIKKITDKEVIGQSIVSGNVRPLKGTAIKSGNTLTFRLREPGDDKFDGEFTFEIKNDTLSGNWVSYNKSVLVKKRSYKLIKKAFIYNPDLMLSDEDTEEFIDYVNPQKVHKTNQNGAVYEDHTYRFSSDKIFTLNASTQVMVEDTLKNLRKLDLEILRNTIYARHGYSFKKAGVRQFFDFIDWYVPVSNNVDNQLTALEKENISILKRFEQYATDSYDYFGR
jgi:YARHG domain-containing protein